MHELDSSSPGIIPSRTLTLSRLGLVHLPIDGRYIFEKASNGVTSPLESLLRLIMSKTLRHPDSPHGSCLTTEVMLRAGIKRRKTSENPSGRRRDDRPEPDFSDARTELPCCMIPEAQSGTCTCYERLLEAQGRQPRPRHCPCERLSAFAPHRVPRATATRPHSHNSTAPSLVTMYVTSTPVNAPGPPTPLSQKW